MAYFKAGLRLGVRGLGMATAGSAGAVAVYCGMRREEKESTPAPRLLSEITVPCVPFVRQASCEGLDTSHVLAAAAVAGAVGLAWKYSGSSEVSSEINDEVETFANAPHIDQSNANAPEAFSQAVLASEKQEHVKAFTMFQMAADEGYARALSALGACYEEGVGVEKSDEKAFECYTAAARLGVVDAMVRVAVFYDLGKGPVETDLIRANQIFAVASDRGDAEAKFYLAWAYMHGEGGVEKDSERCVALLNEAASMGHTKSKQVLASLAQQQSQ